MPKIMKDRSRSDCWIFFTKAENGGICKFCSKLVKSTGNTTNLLNHVRRIHRQEWDNREKHKDSSDNRTESPDIEHYIVSYENSDENQERASKENSQIITSDEGSHNGMSGNSQTHSVETYQTAQGDTVIWLQPSVSLDRVQPENHQNTTFHPQITIVSHASESETILPNGEIVVKTSDEQNEDQANTSTSEEQRTIDKQEETQKKVIIKNMKAKSMKKAVRNMSSSTPSSLHLVRKSGFVQSPNLSNKEDLFDNFGKYIASLLRNLPSRKSACRLQKDMIWLVLQEQMRLEDD